MQFKRSLTVVVTAVFLTSSMTMASAVTTTVSDRLNCMSPPGLGIDLDLVHYLSYKQVIRQVEELSLIHI